MTKMIKLKKKVQKTGSNNKQEEGIIICIQEVKHDEKEANTHSHTNANRIRLTIIDVQYGTINEYT